MGFIVKAALLLVFLILLPEGKARLVTCGGCDEVPSELKACANLIGINVQINSPSCDCCLGLQAIAEAAAVLGDARTCQCIRRNALLLPVLAGPLLRFNAQVLHLAYGQCRYILGINDGTPGNANLPLECLAI